MAVRKSSLPEEVPAVIAGYPDAETAWRMARDDETRELWEGICALRREGLRPMSERARSAVEIADERDLYEMGPWGSPARRRRMRDLAAEDFDDE